MSFCTAQLPILLALTIAQKRENVLGFVALVLPVELVLEPPPGSVWHL
jgi:hypothetical protein